MTFLIELEDQRNQPLELTFPLLELTFFFFFSFSVSALNDCVAAV